MEESEGIFGDLELGTIDGSITFAPNSISKVSLSLNSRKVWIFKMERKVYLWHPRHKA